MKSVIWKQNKRIKMVGVPDCFLPQQLINMADGTKKPIVEIKEGDAVEVFDEAESKVKDGVVHEVKAIVHDDCYELYLANDKILYPTGNHPFLTKEKGWATIDGHDPNHAGGSKKLAIGDEVIQVGQTNIDDYVEIVNIAPLNGEHECYNLVNQDYETIIADDIVTHNTSAVIGGTENPIEMMVSQKDEDGKWDEKSIYVIGSGDIILGANPKTNELEDTAIVSLTKDKTSEGVVLMIVTDNDDTLLYTSTHIIPYYRDDNLIEDNMGTLQIGDKLICLNSDKTEIEQVAVKSIDEAKKIEEEVDVIHPHTEKGYHFVNNILVEG